MIYYCIVCPPSTVKSPPITIFDHFLLLSAFPLLAITLLSVSFCLRLSHFKSQPQCLVHYVLSTNVSFLPSFAFNSNIRQHFSFAVVLLLFLKVYVIALIQHMSLELDRLYGCRHLPLLIIFLVSKAFMFQQEFLLTSSCHYKLSEIVRN